MTEPMPCGQVRFQYWLEGSKEPNALNGCEHADGTLSIEYAEDCWHTRKERSTMEKDIIGSVLTKIMDRIHEKKRELSQDFADVETATRKERAVLKSAL